MPDQTYPIPPYAHSIAPLDKDLETHKSSNNPMEAHEGNEALDHVG